MPDTLFASTATRWARRVAAPLLVACAAVAVNLAQAQNPPPTPPATAACDCYDPACWDDGRMGWEWARTCMADRPDSRSRGMGHGMMGLPAGTTLTVTDTKDGAIVSFATTDPAQVGAVRDAAHRMTQMMQPGTTGTWMMDDCH